MRNKYRASIYRCNELDTRQWSRRENVSSNVLEICNKEYYYITDVMFDSV
jgi:hypothetical protein